MVLNENARVDFLILTVLDVELNAVLRNLSGWIPQNGNACTYYLGSLPVNDTGEYRLVVTNLEQPGNVEAAAKTASHINVWNPRHVVLVGIGGGISGNDIAIGDVVVADTVWYYELGKVTTSRIEIRPQSIPCDANLVSRFRTFANITRKPWLIGNQLAPRYSTGDPRIVVGPIGSGEKVIADGETSASFVSSLLQYVPKMRAVAMEGTGVGRAAMLARPGGVPFLEVRGISDLADPDKNDSWHEIASNAAAECLFSFLRTHPVPTNLEAKCVISSGANFSTAQHGRSFFAVGECEQLVGACIEYMDESAVIQVLYELPSRTQRRVASLHQGGVPLRTAMESVCRSTPRELMYLAESILRASDWISESESPSTPELNDCISRIRSLIADQGQLALIPQIIKPLLAANVDVNAVLNIVSRWCPRDILGIGQWYIPAAANPEDSLRSALLQLLDAPADTTTGVYPVLGFAQDAAELIPELTEELLTWARAAVVAQVDQNPHDPVPQEHRQMSKPSSDPTEISGATSPPNLLLILRPRGDGAPGSFALDSWLFHGSDIRDRLGSRAITLDDMPLALQDLLDTVESYDGIDARLMAKMMIHIFLPCEEFSLDVDNWRIDGIVRLGVQYRVVIRSYERLLNRRFRAIWQSKWDRLSQGSSTEISDASVHWIEDADGCASERLHAFLVQDHIICLGSKIVPPVSHEVNSYAQIFRSAISAGTPIVIWPRRVSEHLEKQQQMIGHLESLVNPGHIRDLPTRILELRQSAARAGDLDHIGYSLSLMWDDPTVMPPAGVKLQAPGIRGDV